MAKIILICLILASSIAVALTQTCGQSPKMRMNRRYDPEGQRIVGGVEARPGSHPWIVSLQLGPKGSHVCGGTLIRAGKQEESDIVVTAAHCLVDPPPLQIQAGSHNHKNQTKDVQTVKIVKAVSHPSYNEETKANDIAILQLATPIKFNANIQPACLPTPGEQIPDNTQGTVAGWGRTKEGAKASDILMQVGVPVFNSASCAKSYKAVGETIDKDVMLCAGYAKGGKDSCEGDSGGPFIFNGTNGYTLQGVVSFGEGCARPGQPGVYARVSSFIPWINQQIKSLSKVA